MNGQRNVLFGDATSPTREKYRYATVPFIVLVVSSTILFVLTAKAAMIFALATVGTYGHTLFLVFSPLSAIILFNYPCTKSIHVY
jgi:hypothetical protein